MTDDHEHLHDLLSEEASGPIATTRRVGRRRRAAARHRRTESNRMRNGLVLTGVAVVVGGRDRCDQCADRRPGGRCHPTDPDHLEATRGCRSTWRPPAVDDTSVTINLQADRRSRAVSAL